MQGVGSGAPWGGVEGLQNLLAPQGLCSLLEGGRRPERSNLSTGPGLGVAGLGATGVGAEGSSGSQLGRGCVGPRSSCALLLPRQEPGPAACSGPASTSSVGAEGTVRGASRRPLRRSPGRSLGRPPPGGSLPPARPPARPVLPPPIPTPF